MRYSSHLYTLMPTYSSKFPTTVMIQLTFILIMNVRTVGDSAIVMCHTDIYPRHMPIIRGQQHRFDCEQLFLKQLKFVENSTSMVIFWPSTPSLRSALQQLSYGNVTTFQFRVWGTGSGDIDFLSRLTHEKSPMRRKQHTFRLWTVLTQSNFMMWKTLHPVELEPTIRRLHTECLNNKRFTEIPWNSSSTQISRIPFFPSCPIVML